MSARSVAIAALLGVTLGIGAGVWVKTRFDQADEVSTLKGERHETAAGIADSAVASVALSNDIAADSANIDQIQTAVAARTVKYLAKQESRHDEPSTPNEPQPSPTSHSSAGLVLDVGTVRLLNAARTGHPATLDSAGRGVDQK